MTTLPRFSVVMPSFNQAQYLDSAIQSVLSQGTALHELIVLDGGSTDGSADVIRRYSKDIAYWRSEKDEGQTAAIQEGFERATGDILCWLNSDDLFLPDALARVAETFAANEGSEIVSGYLYYIDEESRITECPQVLTGSHRLARLGVVTVNQQATFFRKGLFDRVGGIDASLHCAMDMDLWCRFHTARANWVQIPQYLAAFRKHSAAKGGRGAWWDRYQEEKARVRARYPELYGSPTKQKAGLALYRAAQLLAGRHLKGILETKRLSGRVLGNKDKP